MKKILAILVVTLALTTNAFAERAKVSVNGMVCSFCAQGIKKKFSAHPSIAKCEVDLDKKEVSLEFKKEKTISDDEIKNMIKESGYEVVRPIERFKD